MGSREGSSPAAPRWQDGSCFVQGDQELGIFFQGDQELTIFCVSGSSTSCSRARGMRPARAQQVSTVLVLPGWHHGRAAGRELRDALLPSGLGAPAAAAAPTALLGLVQAAEPQCHVVKCGE